RLEGFYTIFQDGFDYYLLIGWSAESTANQSSPAFRQLEAGLRITKTNHQRLDEIAAPLKLDMPYLSDKAARWIAESTRTMELTPEELHYAGYGLLQSEIRELPSRDRSEFNAILSRAFSTLGPADYARLKADQSKMLEDEPLDAQETNWYQ